MKLLLLLKLVLLAPITAAAIANVTLTPENTVFLTGEISPIQLADVAEQLTVTTKTKKDDIYLVVHSPGGMTLGISMFASLINVYPNVKLLIVRAESAAAAISQLYKGKRLIVERGSMLFHEVRFGTNQIMTYNRWVATIMTWKADTDAFNVVCSQRLKITLQQYVDKVTDKNWMLEAKEAVDIGAAEEIVHATCSPELKKADIQVDEPNMKLQKYEQRNICDLL